MFHYLFLRIKRLVVSIFSQWFMFCVMGFIYIWGNFFLPDKIRHFFSVEQLQNQIEQKTLAIDFMKKIAGATNLTAYLNYMTSVLEKTTLLSRMNMMEMFSNLCEFLAVGLMNLVVIGLGIYTFIRILRVYRTKTIQHENVSLITRELMPQIKALQIELHQLKQEILSLKNDT